MGKKKWMKKMMKIMKIWMMMKMGIGVRQANIKMMKVMMMMISKIKLPGGKINQSIWEEIKETRASLASIYSSNRRKTMRKMKKMKRMMNKKIALMQGIWSTGTRT